MGRKKKVIVEEQPKTEEVKKEQTTSIGYQGTVKVSIQRGNTTISKKTYHNKGFPTLFKFICKALAGDFNTDLRPCKIVLFGGKDGEDIDEDTDLSDSGLNPTLTTFILYDTTAIVGTNGDTVTYHFRIPASYLKTTTGETSKTQIYKAALYGATTNDSGLENEKCAIYLFTSGTGDNRQWAPIEVNTSLKGNYSIIIEWTMTIYNTKEAA